MAPESIRTPQNVDHRIDIYAIGVVGYYLLTAHELFDGATLMEIYAKHLNDPPLPPSKRLGSALPSDLERLILRCLEKSADARPATAEELAEALHGCADSEGWTQVDARAWWDANRSSIGKPREGGAGSATATRRATGPRQGTQTLVVDYVQRIGAD